jgi:hypothetical protein
MTLTTFRPGSVYKPSKIFYSAQKSCAKVFDIVFEERAISSHAPRKCYCRNNEGFIKQIEPMKYAP